MWALQEPRIFRSASHTELLREVLHIHLLHSDVYNEIQSHDGGAILVAG